MAPLNAPLEAVTWLRTPEAIRSRCGAVFAAADAATLNHFALDLERLDTVADYVIETMRAAYPAMDIPYHSRWRHFCVGGRNRWAKLAAALAAPSEEIARVRVELAVTSVLLDAGAGEQWRYREPGGDNGYQRSEGLAVASFNLFVQGAFSARSDAPLRVDAEALCAFTPQQLATALQVTDDNPLVGLQGRVELLRRLGAALESEAGFFGVNPPRLGNLFDFLQDQVRDDALPASVVLNAVLRSLGSVWPGGIELGGLNLGDVGRHRAIQGDDLTAGLVPFHKLSQWLSYSLVEPLEEAGIQVTDLDALTGLPEYRNSGLFIDLGVLQPKHDGILGKRHRAESELVVEWRALTVVLLDRLAERIRGKLGLDRVTLPLAKILQGGTWSAGRRIARERRPDGAPPIQLLSDGTVF